jgi:hypothetical protein
LLNTLPGKRFKQPQPVEPQLFEHGDIVIKMRRAVMDAEGRIGRGGVSKARLAHAMQEQFGRVANRLAIRTDCCGLEPEAAKGFQSLRRSDFGGERHIGRLGHGVAPDLYGAAGNIG